MVFDSQATETRDTEVCWLGEEPYKNNSDGDSTGDTISNGILFLVFFTSLSSLLVLRAESMCGLSAAIQKERISGLLHDMIKEKQACKINTNLLGYEHCHWE